MHRRAAMHVAKAHRRFTIARSAPRASLGFIEAIAVLAGSRLHQRQQLHRHASPLSHHAHQQGRSGDSPSQPRVPAGARGVGGEHDGEDLTVGDLAADEIWQVNHRALRYVPIMWGPLTHGPRCQRL